MCDACQAGARIAGSPSDSDTALPPLTTVVSLRLVRYAARCPNRIEGNVARRRFPLIWFSTRVGARWARIPQPVGGLVWMGLVSQAGVTLGLTLLIAAEFPTWGQSVNTLVVALIALHQLAGPVLFRAALIRAGEVGRARLTEGLVPEEEEPRPSEA